MRINTKRGHYMVETAVFLPVFIIAVMTIGCYINVVGADENVIHGFHRSVSAVRWPDYHPGGGDVQGSLISGKGLL